GRVPNSPASGQDSLGPAALARPQSCAAGAQSVKDGTAQESPRMTVLRCDIDQGDPLRASESPLSKEAGEFEPTAISQAGGSGRPAPFDGPITPREPVSCCGADSPGRWLQRTRTRVAALRGPPIASGDSVGSKPPKPPNLLVVRNHPESSLGAERGRSRSWW